MIEVKNFVACPEALPLVAKRVFEQWFSTTPGFTEQSMLERMQGGKEGALPIGLVAFVDGEPAGTVSLLEKDLKEPSEYRPWLAGLLVFPEFRDKGIGAALVKSLEQSAADIGEHEVYLVTEIPQFYQKLGWGVVERSAHEERLVVMRREL